MKTIQIEIPEGKEAKWVNGVLTLVDEKPVEFKYKVGDKVHSTFDSVITAEHIITEQVALDGEPYYKTDGLQYALIAEQFIRPCDERPKVEFKFKVGDKIKIKRVNQVQTITSIDIYNGVPVYRTDGNSTLTEEQIELYTKPQNITERIKTFEDACKWCKDNGKQGLYEQYADALNVGLQRANDILAYLKLRIITCALNEGWEPKFERGEYRWYAWYDFLTNEELDDMTKEKIKERGICRVVGRAGGSAGAYGGLVYSFAVDVSSNSYTNYGSRLAFRSEELAEYAAKQFIDIYADFCYKGKE